MVAPLPPSGFRGDPARDGDLGARPLLEPRHHRIVEFANDDLRHGALMNDIKTISLRPRSGNRGSAAKSMGLVQLLTEFGDRLIDDLVAAIPSEPIGDQLARRGDGDRNGGIADFG